MTHTAGRQTGADGGGQDRHRREDVSFDSSRVTCAAWLYRPLSPSGPVPAVVLGPGLAGVRGAGLGAFAERLAAAGLAAFVFDYRCLGGSGGRPRQVVRVRHQLADWHAAIAAVRAQPGIDPTRVAVWGGSIGGGYAVKAAAEDPSLSAVVAHAPLTSGVASTLAVRPAPRQQVRLIAAGLADQVRALLRLSPKYIPVVGPPGALAVLTTADAEPDYRAIAPPGWDERIAARVTLDLPLFRPGAAAANVRCPVFLAVADEDTITPPGQAARAMSRAEQVEIHHYPMRHFQSFHGAQCDRMVAAAIDFLCRHLQPSV